ncbi:KDO2-lipid IV(A) lauroyltransferase [Flexibacter flexilis DSM 6793]|uniref:KDO2-lipid IV(A) lauroyltransferase n=2 Tax=Flexibacter flexilis TaxID=998 RepID=A0A1I1KAQ3_9BACT|nr:KDO2-lipid IV(A) lauroyltransferase [Flexibacter flexilis DSM 6793]
MFFIRLISKLPFWALYLISDFLYVLMAHVIGYRRKVIIENLQKCFPEKSAAELDAISKDFYRNLCDVIVETFKVLDMNVEQMQQRVQTTNLPLLTDMLDAGTPVLIMTTHQCNWEWLLPGCGTAFSYPTHGAYKPLHNQFFDKVMLSIRSRFGAKLIADTQILRESLRYKDEVRVVALVADQTPSSPKLAYKTLFLHRPTAFFTGTERLAYSLGYPVIFAEMKRVKRGFYEVTYHDIAKPPYDKNSHQILEGYVRQTEAAIRRAPSNWLWSHRRWKHHVDLD